MIVVDASAMLEVLLRTRAGRSIEERVFEPGETLHAPHLVDLEIAQVLRRYAAAGEISAGRGREALDDLAAFRLRRWAHDALVLRIWDLRQNLTAYDAEALDAPLLTRDRRLAAAPGISGASGDGVTGSALALRPTLCAVFSGERKKRITLSAACGEGPTSARR